MAWHKVHDSYFLVAKGLDEYAVLHKIRPEQCMLGPFYVDYRE
jgi:hypothetical protein